MIPMSSLKKILKIKYLVISICAVLLYLLLKPLYPYVAGCTPVDNPIEIKEAVVKINNLDIYYLTAGDSQKPPLVFLHGTGGTKKISQCRKEQIMTALGKDFYVYLPLHPGASKSQLPTFAWSTTDYAFYIDGFLNELKIEKPVMMGQSFGGRIGLRYAIEYPDKISLLVLSDPAIRLESTSLKYQGVLLYIGKPLLSFIFNTSWIPESIKGNVAQIALSIPEEAIPGGDYSELDAVISSMTNNGSNEIFTEDDIQKITTPTILIWGKHDDQFPIERGRALDRLIFDSALYEYEAGHTAIYQDTEKTISIIIEKFNDTSKDN